MCGRFIQIADPEKIRLAISDLDISNEARSGFRPRYNITPTQNIMAVINTPLPSLVLARWGLVPFWAKDISMGSKMINARAETMREKSSFRTPFKRRRCIIFADAFYEWKAAGRGRTPHAVAMKDAAPFGMAGLWDVWSNPVSGAAVTSATIITTTPNELVSGIHDRMPAILKPGDYRTWLFPGDARADDLMRCIAPYPSEEMTAYAVSRLVNDPHYDAPDCMAPLSP